MTLKRPDPVTTPRVEATEALLLGAILLVLAVLLYVVVLAASLAVRA